MNAADQNFFNAKGGKIGLWTLAAPTAFLDDFGGGALDGVSTAALDEAAETVTADAADTTTDETDEAVPPVTDDPTANAQINRLFLPLVNR